MVLALTADKATRQSESPYRKGIGPRAVSLKNVHRILSRLLFELISSISS